MYSILSLCCVWKSVDMRKRVGRVSPIRHESRARPERCAQEEEITYRVYSVYICTMQSLAIYLTSEEDFVDVYLTMSTMLRLAHTFSHWMKRDSKRGGFVTGERERERARGGEFFPIFNGSSSSSSRNVKGKEPDDAGHTVCCCWAAQ